MAAAKIKKGDQVVVLSGKDKGRTGTVTRSPIPAASALARANPQAVSSRSTRTSVCRR